VVVDHLHYIDGDPKATENRALKEVVQTVRDVQRRIEKPVILVAHVRKADRSHKTLIPTLDDFHGSSDVSKIATKAVMIAPAWAERSSVPYLSMTYIEPAKFRVEGSRTRYVAMVAFNFRTGRYQPAFALGKLNEAREKWEPVPEREIPEWAIERPPPTSAPAGAPPPPEAGDPGVSA
jgi:hypothetical protein